VLPADPLLRESSITVAIPIAAWLLARGLSLLLQRAAGRASALEPQSLQRRLARAVNGPLTYAIVLGGLAIAVHRLPLAERLKAGVDDLLFTAGVAVVALGALRTFGILLSWYASESRLGTESALASEFGPLLSKLGKIVITLIALITVLQHFRIDVNSLVVSLGVGSLAVGLAAQDTLSNMFAGFTLMLDRPFKIGDRIQLATGEIGDVEAIGIRATRVRTLEDTLLVIPNATLVKERVVNQSRPTRRVRVRAEVRVAHGSDVATTRRVLAEAALSSQYVDPEKPPVVLLTRVADSGLTFQVVAWARDFAEQGLALSEIYEHALRRLKDASVERPGV
jgi:small-conductance mechanosensitive channel